MAAYVSNIVIESGANFDQSFNLENSANAPLDLTGYSGASMLKKHSASLTTAASLSVSFPNRTQGQLRISLGSTVTSNLKPGRYVYDILLSDASAMKTRVVEGSAIVTAGVTTS